MRELLFWLFWMFLAQQISNSIEKDPEIWTSPVFWGALVTALLVFGIIEIKVIQNYLEAKYSGENANLKSLIELLRADKKSLEDRLKLEEEKSAKQKDDYGNQIEALDKRIEEEKPSTICLTTDEFKVLEFIEAFDKINPIQSNQFPLECSVQDAASGTGLDIGKVNDIFRKLRKLDFIHSIWDNQATYLNMEQPINEEKAARIISAGKEFLETHRAS